MMTSGGDAGIKNKIRANFGNSNDITGPANQDINLKQASFAAHTIGSQSNVQRFSNLSVDKQKPEQLMINKKLRTNIQEYGQQKKNPEDGEI